MTATSPQEVLILALCTLSMPIVWTRSILVLWILSRHLQEVGNKGLSAIV